MVVYVVPFYDELGQLIEFPLTGTSLGYQSFSAWDGSTETAIASVPGEDPPSGELPLYDSDGTTLLGTVAFVEAGIAPGYQALNQHLTAAFAVALADGLLLPIEFDNAGVSVDPEVLVGRRTASVSILPGELRYRGRDQSEVKLAARVRARVQIRTPLEVGVGDTLSMIDSMASALDLPANTLLLGRSIQTLGVEPVSANGSPDATRSRSAPNYSHAIELEIEYPFSVTPTPDASEVDGSSVTVEIAIQSRFEQLVASPLSLPTVYGNAPDTTDNEAIRARLVVQHGRISPSGAMGNGFRRRYNDRRQGVAIVTLDVRAGSALNQAWAIVDDVVAAFTASRCAAAIFGVPQPSNLGWDGERARVEIACPFVVDDPQ